MENNMMNLFNNLISNPETVKGLKDIIGNVDKGANDEVTPDENKENSSDFSILNTLLSNEQNREILNKISHIYSSYNNNSNPGIRLIEALSPYLSSRRSVNLEKAKSVIRVSNIISELNKKK